MKYPLILLLLICSASSRIDFTPKYIIDFKDDLSEEIGGENISERLEYEHLISADPKTGKIPKNIRNLELNFARQVDTYINKSRTQALDVASAGPFNVGGRTRAVAFDIRNEDIIIAGGVSGGIWKSLDGGISWIRKSNPENRNSVTCLVQDTRPGKEDIWYHGTGEIVGNSARASGAPFRGVGIYKSIDNGETWNILPSTEDSNPNTFNSQFQYIWSIVVNHQNLVEDEVLVAAYGGILKSSDGGDSWDVEVGQKLFDLPSDVDLNESNASFYTDIDQGPNGNFYATLSKASVTNKASLDGGIYISADGDNWFDINPFTEKSNFQRIEIGVSQSNPDIVYFLVDPAFILKFNITSLDENNFVGFFETDKVIPTFESELGDYNSQGSYNMMIKVHPTNENIVFVGGTNLYRSTDGFDTNENTKWIGGYTPEGGSGTYLNHHPDQHDLLFYPSNPNKILSANDGGLMVSDAGTADSVSWRSLNNGFITSQFFTIAQSKEANDPIILGGLQDNGTDLTNTNGLSNWKGLIGGDGGYTATTRDKVLWYAAFQKGQTFRLTLNKDYDLTTFGRVDPANLVAQEGSEYLFINPYILDPSNQNRMFIAGGNHLYFNNNVAQIRGGTQDPSSLGWKKVTQDMDSLFLGSVSALGISSNGKRLYFGTGSGEVFSVDNANDFAQFKVSILDSTSFPSEGFVSCIAVNPEDKDHLLVIFSNYNIPSIFESKNGGASFSDVSGNLEENTDGTGNGPSVRWGEIIPTNTGNLFLVGTSTGLYSTELLNGDQTVWIREANNIIGSAVIPMMDYRPSDGKLVIATHGNGAFTTMIPNFKEINVEIESELFAEVKVYPNPFQETTEINFSIPEDGIVRIDIFSMKGEHITNLLWAPQFAGANSPVTWDGRTNTGASLANGIYLFNIQYNGQSRTGKIILRR